MQGERERHTPEEELPGRARMDSLVGGVRLEVGRVQAFPTGIRR
jgi:hypothetical protein